MKVDWEAPGLDAVEAECLMKGEVTVIEWLVRLLNVCFNSGVLPLDWHRANIFPL